MRCAILGATRGMGREVARRLAARGDSLVLLGRTPDALEAMAEDLRIRGARAVTSVPLDLADDSAFDAALDATVEALGQLDAFVITAGLFGTQEQLEDDLELTHRVLDVDFTKTILLCERVRVRMLAAGGGTLVVFSSVAGDRGRRSNGLYSAAKAGLSHYLEALDHRFRDKGLVTISVKPGFIRTGMTAGLKEPPLGLAGDPEVVAADVVKAMDRSAPMIYTPWHWRFVMLIILHVPRLIMRRLNF